VQEGNIPLTNKELAYACVKAENTQTISLFSLNSWLQVSVTSWLVGNTYDHQNLTVWSTLSEVPKYNFNQDFYSYLCNEKNVFAVLKNMFDFTNFTILVQMPESAKDIKLKLPGMKSKQNKTTDEEESSSDESSNSSTVMFAVALVATAVVGSFLLFKWQQQQHK
jgi:hypothetical protein